MTYTDDSPMTAVVIEDTPTIEKVGLPASARAWRARPVVDDFGHEVIEHEADQ